MTMIYISPSQIDTFRMCRRRWAFRYIDGIRTPQSPEMHFGEEGHSQTERYLKTGDAPDSSDVGRTVAQGIKPGFLPAPGPELLIEQKFEIRLDCGALLIGKIDLVDPRAEPIRVADHKFTKDLRYAKTESDALEDPQSVIYAAWALEYFKKFEIEWNWLYYAASGKTRPRRPSGTRRVSRILSPVYLQEGWAKVMADVTAMVIYKRAKGGAIVVPCDEGACMAYNRECPHMETCKPSSNSRFAALFRQGVKTIKNKLTRTPKENGMSSLLATLEQQAGAVNPPEGAQQQTPSAPVADGQAGLFAAQPPAAAAPPPQTGMFTNVPPGHPQQPASVQAAAAPPPQQTAQATVAAQPPPTQPVPQPPQQPASAEIQGLIVVMDAALAKHDRSLGAQNLIDFLQPVMQQVAQANGAVHWATIDYGKGPGFLAQAFDTWLVANRPTGYLMVDGSTAEARAVKEVLMHRASVVIKGVR